MAKKLVEGHLATLAKSSMPARQLTIRDYSWTGEQSILDVRCLAEENDGLYIGAESEDDLIAALRKTLDCPMSTQRASLWLGSAGTP